MTRDAISSASDGRTVIVVGGGIAGLYCARELAARGLTVDVLELTDRFGGRIETGRLEPGQDGPGSTPFAAEFGPMRFELELQPLFAQLLDDYDFNPEPFPPPGGADAPLRFDLGDDEMVGDQELPAVQLFKLGVCRLFGLDAAAAPGDNPEDPPQTVLTPESAETLQNLRDDNGGFDALRRTATVPGTDRLLRDEGLWNALTYTLSPNAVRKITQHGSFFHFLPENLSALEWGIFWLRAFQMQEGLTTLSEGVDTLTARLVNDVGTHDSVTLHTRREVLALRAAPDGRVEVDIAEPDGSSTTTMAADHVILAIPKAPLVALADALPSEIRKALDSVNAFPMVKVFCVTKTPDVWRHAATQQLPQQGAWLVPTREVHYLPLGEPREHTMVMFYTDRPSTTFWQRYVVAPESHDRAEVNRNPDLAEQLAMALTTLHIDTAKQELARRRAMADVPTGGETSPSEVADVLLGLLETLLDGDADVLFTERGRPELAAIGHALAALRRPDERLAWQRENLGDYAIRDWARMPYGAASHAWVPGSDALAVMDSIRAFSLTGNGRENVHIVGEAYSDYQGFIEGALRSARAAIDAIAPA